MRLTKKANKSLKSEQVMKICLELGISYDTFKRWQRDNHRNLLRLDVVQCISMHTGIPENQIIEKEPVKDPA